MARPATMLLLFATILCVPVDGFSTPMRTPEQAVQRQLDALQKLDIEEAFEFNSESNQAVTGPWQSFAASLAEGAFRPLLGHGESCVLMTICHGDYTCCLVKVVPSERPLPSNLARVIADTRRAEGLQTEDEEDSDEEGKPLPACSLYWWEVSKQYDDEEDEDNFYYLVDSVLPDAEDLELDYMETTLFAIGDEFDEDATKTIPPRFSLIWVCDTTICWRADWQD